VQVVYHNIAMKHDQAVQQQQQQQQQQHDGDVKSNAKEHITTGRRSNAAATLRGNGTWISVYSLSARTRGSKFFLRMLPLLSLIVMCWGVLVPSWTFHVRGMVGLVAEFGQANSTIRTYSFYSAIQQLVEQSTITTPMSSSVGVLFITGTYAAFSFLVPCLHLIFLFLLFSIPMSTKKLVSFQFITHILMSVSAMEVWILATVVTVLQIQFVSYSVLDAQCSTLLPIFQTFVRYGFIQNEDANCFQIDGSFEWMGLLLLIISVVASHIATTCIMRDVERAVAQRQKDDKDESEHEHDDDDDDLMRSLLSQERIGTRVSGAGSLTSINY